MMLMGPWFVLVVVAVIVAVWASQRREDDGDDVALRVLDRRLAEGDLTVAEHAQRRQALREHGGARSSSNRWALPGAVVAIGALIVIFVAWFGMTSWGDGGWMGGHMGWRGSTSSTTEVVEGAREVEVDAGDLWFDPATVEMVAGEPVNLRLVNTGEAFHDLTIPAANVVLAAEPGEQAAGAIEFAEPGRYEFFCSVPGHAQAGMRATIVVTEAS
jgi:uncharacterized cupredoxin-like copper-binding protein